MVIVLFLIPIIAIVAVFTFVAIATWTDNRRKEREAFYRHDTYRKLIERSEEGGRAVLELMRQEELQRMRKRKEGLKLAGMITFVTGGALMVFLYFVVPDTPIYLVGLFPLLVGAVLFLHALSLPEQPRPQAARE